MKSISACILIITLLWANALFAQTSGNASNQLLLVPEATDTNVNEVNSKKTSGATITFTDIKVSTPSGITNAPAYTLIVK